MNYVVVRIQQPPLKKFSVVANAENSKEAFKLWEQEVAADPTGVYRYMTYGEYEKESGEKK